MGVPWRAVQLEIREFPVENRRGIPAWNICASNCDYRSASDVKSDRRFVERTERQHISLIVSLRSVPLVRYDESRRLEKGTMSSKVFEQVAGAAITVHWLLVSCLLAGLPAAAAERPDTGISGVYEVMVGVSDAEPALTYFAEFGFTTVARAELTATQAKALYGVESAVTSWRLQNGEVDAHGLLRLLEWDEPSGPGVGLAPPRKP